MSLSTYNDYKQSRYGWLGNVPEHWTVGKTAWYFNIAMGQTILREELIDDGGWPVFSATDGDHYFGRVDNPRVQLNVGDIVIPARGNSIGAVKIVKEPATTTQTTIYCKNMSAGRLMPEYVYHYLCGCKAHLFYFTQTAIPQITVEEVGSNPILIPPLDEQKAIASFLDRETSKIDALVTEQRRLIELLKEKRQAVISHAVTKGLDPNVKMKPSGIEWLGDVPKHWDVEMLARVTSKIGNGFVGPTRDILVESGVPYIQATHIKKGRVNFDGAYFVTHEWAEWQSKAALELDDVLIVQTGAGTGDVGLVSTDEVGYRCHALIIVRSIKQRLLGSFLSAVLQSQYGRQKLESIQTGGMHPHLNCGNVKFVFVPLPPPSEQQRIVQHASELSSTFDSLIAEAERAITLLQERRTALISAAVTGKIDVRGFEPI